MTNLIRILAIDGGGIRGIVPAQVLVTLELKLQQKTGNPNARIADYFDLLAGTSTGGILTLLSLVPNSSGRPRYSACDAVELYFKHGPDIFHQPFYHRLLTLGGVTDEKYPAEGIEGVLRDYFGDTCLSQLLKPCMIPAYDLRRRKAVFFTQHDAIQKGPSRDFYLRDVARATTAAPAYFEAANIESRSGIHYPCIDGGVFANNPALCAYAEARTHYGSRASDMAILSLGTGDVAKPYYHEHAKNWGAIEWMRPLIDIMMSGVAETVDYECRLAFEAVGVPQQYLRIDVPLRELPPGITSDMDNTSPENLNGLKEVGSELAEHRSADLDRFAQLLIEHHSE